MKGPVVEPQPQPPLLEVAQVGGVTVARLTAPDLMAERLAQDAGRQLARLVEGGGRLVVDFRGVKMFGTTLLSQLIALYAEARKPGGRLALCGLNPYPAEVLETTRLNTVFNVYPDEAEALQSFGE